MTTPHGNAIRTTIAAVRTGLALAVLVSGIAATTPLRAQQVTLGAAYARGSGSLQSGVTVGDNVTLTATARNLRPNIAWNLQIWQIAPGKRLLSNCGQVSSCAFSISQSEEGSFTYQAILNQPPQVARPIYSNPAPVVWTFRTPTQLVLEVGDRRVAVNFTFTDPNTSRGVKEDSRIWRPVPGTPPNPVGSPIAPGNGVNWTSDVHARSPVEVHAYFNSALPKPWGLFVKLGGTNDLCGPQPLRCDIVIPHPALGANLTPWLAGAFLYRGTDYVDRVDINIRWVNP